jgi:hypothetical protein
MVFQEGCHVNEKCHEIVTEGKKLAFVSDSIFMGLSNEQREYKAKVTLGKFLLE